ncbi:ATP-dependent DNA helicase [Virgibacillus indicus]|uniref:ATP-dependent DNA helicase n=1 Tax=Virgibacillus indicus TaxID=2024554 RepID=A0A265NE35_9BACI|nr:RecQ family ATP-dependent DNA helicase [Virgibacillus indicus]OZU90081.1 ATP-dependent DNA helicase [Virgibacillus indicus]
MKQHQSLEESLKTYFGYTSFRTGQKEIIKDIMNGKDILGILPTGSGKSICYQLPAKLLEGITIVVSPLISLMIDQVKQLKAANFKEVIALNSFMEPVERNIVYQNLHRYKLIYISPELLQKQELQKKLVQLNINLFVIDEAHCISQWGHEFRPDYLKLNTIIERLDNPTVLALSATAALDVQDDISKALKRPTITKHIYPMDRDNITFCVQEVSHDHEKISILHQLLSDYHVPALIYFTSRKAAENTAQLLSVKNPSKRIAFYHGGMEQIDRITIQQQFMNDQLDVVCCTSAFGMGINKSNIHLVIHYHLPPQLESYIQEVGRAGRDGASSVGLLLISPNDVYLPRSIIEKELPSPEDIGVIFQQLLNYFKSGEKLPANEASIENMFQLNEVQWRFLRNQLEEHGMIDTGKIKYDKDIWIAAYHSIGNLINERKLVKKNKLNEMVQWVFEKDCLRKNLYKGFQSTYSPAAYHCCSNCGFTFSEWSPVETKQNVKNSLSWESKLKKLLLIGEGYEAK